MHFQNLSSTMPWLSRQTLSEEFCWKHADWVLVENVLLCRRQSIAWVLVRLISVSIFFYKTETFRNAIKKNYLWFPSQDSIGVEGGDRSWFSYEPRQWERGVLLKMSKLYFINWPCSIRLVKLKSTWPYKILTHLPLSDWGSTQLWEEDRSQQCQLQPNSPSLGCLLWMTQEKDFCR